RVGAMRIVRVWCWLGILSLGVSAGAQTWRAERLAANPIITPQTDHSIGTNINGPSLIRVPGWVPHPLGRYYLYFADHNGKYIRLAYADRLQGPWKIHAPGALQLSQSYFSD